MVQLLTEDLEELTEGKVAINNDPVKAAKGTERHITKNGQN